MRPFPRSSRLLLLAAALLAPAVAAEPGMDLALHAGAYDVGDFAADTAEFGVEIQLSPLWRGRLPRRLTLRPAVGVAATSDSADWAWAGLRADLETGPRWRVSPLFGVALFDEGDGKDLGGAVEFRSGIEISRRLGRSRLGVTFYHLSNAGIYDDNPGSNSLVLTWTLPLGG